MTGMLSRFETWQGTAATYSLEGRGQASLAGLKHSKAQQPLTSWRVEDSTLSRHEIQQGIAATYILEITGQVSSAGLKHNVTQKTPTNWRAEHQHGQAI